MVDLIFKASIEVGNVAMAATNAGKNNFEDDEDLFEQFFGGQPEDEEEAVARLQCQHFATHATIASDYSHLV